MKNLLITYVRGEDRKPYGCLIGMKLDSGELRIGWAKCHKNDNFIKSIGVGIALGRIQNGTNKAVPWSLQPYYNEFEVRCKKFFFKNNKNSSPAKREYSERNLKQNQVVRRYKKNGKNIVDFEITRFTDRGYGVTFGVNGHQIDELRATYKGKTIILNKTSSGRSFSDVKCAYISRNLFAA